MRNKIKIYKNIGIVILVTLLTLVMWIVFITEKNRNMTNANSFLVFSIDNHLWIMASLIIISIAFGFFWANRIYAEVEEEKKHSSSILKTVLLFLNNEERTILNFLVEKGGKTTQSEISKLHRMTRVKAFRSLQKMESRRLLSIEHHGKIRKISLQKEILDTLLENPKEST